MILKTHQSSWTTTMIRSSYSSSVSWSESNVMCAWVADIPIVWFGSRSWSSRIAEAKRSSGFRLGRTASAYVSWYRE